MEDNDKSFLEKLLKTLRLNESVISTFLGGLVVVVVGILIYNYFSSVNKVEGPIQGEVIEEGLKLVEENGELVPQALPSTHTVVKGEHLWQIAEKYYGSGYNWVDIAEANKLVNADLLAEGQVLSIPKTAVIQLEEETVTGIGVKTDVARTTGSVLLNEYTVVKGDTLWNICVRSYGDGYKWTEVWEANKDKVANPDVIEVGTVLTLPR